jgi:2-aminoadipate transaminase
VVLAARGALWTQALIVSAIPRMQRVTRATSFRDHVMQAPEPGSEAGPPNATRISEAALSPYGACSADPSPVSRLMQAFSRAFRPGVDVNLGVGYVNEETIPAASIERAMNHVVTHPDEHPHAFNYGESKGSERLESALRRYIERHYLGGLPASLLSARELLIGANGATSILYALAQVLPKGVVITTQPEYYIYGNLLRRLGFVIRGVPEDHEGIDVQALESALREHGEAVSFVYAVTVGNPSATILSNTRRKALVEVVTGASRRLGKKIPLVLDQAYEWLVHDERTQLLSGVHFDDLGLVYEIGTLAKVLAPALRIGFIFGPRGALMNALVQCTNDIGFSAPLVVQETCAWLLDNIVDEHVKLVRQGYKQKARVVAQALERHLAPWLESCVGGDAGFYYYLTLHNLATGEGSDFYRYCSRTTGVGSLDGKPSLPRVVYLPGNLCVDESNTNASRAARQMRLSFGFASETELTRGVELLGEAARYAGALQYGIVRNVMDDPSLMTFLEAMLQSYHVLTGEHLVDPGPAEVRVSALAVAPFVVLSHGIQAEPVYNFGNALALRLWEMSWDEFTSMPSNRCAEPMHREQRERFLEEVQRTGMARDYSGVRISKSGRRFRIENVTCWNVVDSAGVRLGQAACYPRWVFL